VVRSLSFLDFIYRYGLKQVLFPLDAERCHEAMLWSARHFSRFLPMTPFPKGIESKIGDIEIPGPVGLAAGMDKNGDALPLWERLGFGFIEIGSVLLHPQEGNPRPRIKRLPEEMLWNWMGFPSAGMVRVKRNFRHWQDCGLWPSVPVGINIGLNKEVEAKDAPLHYASVANFLSQFADYFVVNLSSPNTPGLRSLQHRENFKRIVGAVLKAVPHVRVFVKLSPDLPPLPYMEVLEAAERVGVHGIIATNTSGHSGLNPRGHGGVSGSYLYHNSQEKVQAALQGTRLPVIACGGINSTYRTQKALLDGCAAVQLLTALVFKGPAFPHRINQGLYKLLQDAPE